MQSTCRPTFEPSPCYGQESICEPLLVDGKSAWLPLISCPANFPPEVFEIAISQLIHHPEYNSTLILRSETLSESESHFPHIVPKFVGLWPILVIHRKLLPRRPSRDASLEQFCTLYSTRSSSTDHTTTTSIPSTLVLTPVLPNDSSPLPYYHPPVSHLGVRYVQPSEQPPILRIDLVPLPNTPIGLTSRLYRTCLALLDALHRYGWGAMRNYTKRVLHDHLVSRESYQDLCLAMRERHGHLVDRWPKVTDPLKYVFEDIRIATFLMLLWKDSFSSPTEDTSAAPDQPWLVWGRPPGGFLDLGCGNGLLTHILTAEGYDGVGIDLCARASWGHYPLSTRTQLHLHALDPTIWPPPDRQPERNQHLKPGVFIIGNHPDELTPWVPVLSTVYSASGYLSIPCCTWAFDRRYDRASTQAFPVPSGTTIDEFADSLNLGGGGNGGKKPSSSYSMYRVWLASLSLHCGWEVECEMLRIASTRNWAIVGRKRRGKTVREDEEFRRNAEVIIEGVRERGLFKTRKTDVAPSKRASELISDTLT